MERIDNALVVSAQLWKRLIAAIPVSILAPAPRCSTSPVINSIRSAHPATLFYACQRNLLVAPTSEAQKFPFWD
jgi:hypothetical protein